MITALEVYRSLPRYAAARAAGGRVPGLLAGPLAPVRLARRRAPTPPGPGWARLAPRLAGICGSDLATLAGRSSLYFSALVSLPFTPGHEVVAELVEDCAELPAGTRVVLDPVLGCLPRGLDPCPACAAGEHHRCTGVTGGHLSPGVQTGYCHDTGGGWGELLVAHRSQLHVVPDSLPDERAVLVEPLACALHAAGRALEAGPESVLVVGAGAVGLFTVLALSALAPGVRVLVAARHPRQAAQARSFGATEVLSGDPIGGVRRATRALRADPERAAPFLLGGVDVAVEAAGSRDALDTALRSTRAGGRVVLAGMPAAGADLTPAWFRELDVVGAYTGADSFPMAMDLAGSAALDGVVAPPFELPQWRPAVDLALSAGRAGVVKVAFDLRASARSDAGGGQ